MIPTVYKRVFEALSDPSNNVMEKYSLADCHAKGLYSIPVMGEPGTLTRIFYASEQIAPYDIQLHTHRYGINITPVVGTISHITAVEDIKGNICMPSYEYRSGVLNGESTSTYLDQCVLSINSTPLPCGGTIGLSPNDIHTVACTKGSMWIVEECGYEEDTSLFYGLPFTTRGLYNKIPSFLFPQILREVKRGLKRYNYE